MTTPSDTRPAADPLVAATAALEEAKRAEASAKQRSERAKAAHSQAHERTDAQRRALADVIVAEARKGRGNAEIRKITGYTRERVRQICRAAGIEPKD